MGSRGPQRKGEVRGFGRKDNGNQKRSQRGTKMGRGPRETEGMGKGRSQKKGREGWGHCGVEAEMLRRSNLDSLRGSGSLSPGGRHLTTGSRLR